MHHPQPSEVLPPLYPLPPLPPYESPRNSDEIPLQLILIQHNSERIPLECFPTEPCPALTREVGGLNPPPYTVVDIRIPPLRSQNSRRSNTRNESRKSCRRRECCVYVGFLCVLIVLILVMLIAAVKKSL